MFTPVRGGRAGTSTPGVNFSGEVCRWNCQQTCPTEQGFSCSDDCRASLGRLCTRMSFDISVKGSDLSDCPFAPSPLCEHPLPLCEFGVFHISPLLCKYLRVKALLLESSWVVFVQREGLRPWSVKTAVACVLSRPQSTTSGVKAASTEPRDAKVSEDGASFARRCGMIPGSVSSPVDSARY